MPSLRTILAATLLLLVSLLLPTASSHEAPPPLDASTRLLADATDDCGADGATRDCRGTNDLVALDVQEAWDGQLGNVLQFKLWMDKGKAGSITNTIKFSSPAGSKSLAFSSSDNTHFTGSGFDSVGTAQPINDGARFIVTGTVKLATLGLKVGDSISSFSVVSTGPSNDGDFMPGLCHNTVGDCLACTPQPRCEEVAYERPKYGIRGPVQYISLDAPSTTQNVPTDGDGPIVMLQLGSLLPQSLQTVTLTVEGADGVTAGFHAGADTGGAEYTPTAQLSLAAKQGSILHLKLTGTRAGAAGTLTVTATTDIGGRVQATIPYEVKEGAVTTSDPSTDASQTTTTATTTTKGSPALLVPVVGFLLLGLARRRA